MKALRWAAPVLLVVEVVLVLRGQLSFGVAAVVFLTVEAALTLAAVTQAAVAVRAYRASRLVGGTRQARFDAAVRAALPGPIAAIVLHEARLVHSLALSAHRHQHDVPAGAIALRYDRGGRALGLALLAVSVIEVVVVELVIPWAAVRLVVLVLGVYGVLIVLALIGDTAVRPHVLTDQTLRLRMGGWADVTVPRNSIVAVRRRLRTADGAITFTDGALVLAAANQTCIEVDLDQPRELRVGRKSGLAGTIRFSADDPTYTATALSAAVAAVR